MENHPNAEFYNRIASFYDAIAHSSEREATEEALRRLDAMPREKVLEVGFGTGHALLSLAESVGAQGRVAGLDVSEKMAEIATSRLAHSGVDERVELTVAAAPPLPYQSGAFDAVFFSFTLELFPPEEIGEVVAEALRVLRPGGRCTVVAMARPRDEEEDTALEKVYVWMHRRFPHIVDCHPIDVEATLRDGGFDIVDSVHTDIWSLPVAIVTGKKVNTQL